uniref:Nucleoside-diphosphate kinase n=1 Tax=Neogobius melanostomus TaxID=47308 RepID=A0A8C6SZD8_9GOBI
MGSEHSSEEYLADNLIEDEAERKILLAKPTCFLIIGKPGVGKSALAKKIAESWKCILVDDTDILNNYITCKTKPGLELLEILNNGQNIPEEIVFQLILEKLNSPEVEHSGKSISLTLLLQGEQIELIKNLKLTPDLIINIKCPDSDLAERLSGLRQYPETGHFYLKDEWMRDDLFIPKKEKDSTDEEEEEEVHQRKTLFIIISFLKMIEKMVWRPEYLKDNVEHRINIYRDIMLKHLEVHNRHNPLHLLELDGNDKLEDLHMKKYAYTTLLFNTQEDLMRMMSSSNVVAPGFRWRKSRWGRACPVALKEGKFLPGRPDFCVGFQDKMYILSTAEAYGKFTVNPRRYLVPPMPRPPCRVSIIGPSLSGKTTLCNLLAQHYNAEVLDVDTLVQTSLKEAKQERLKRIKKEATAAAIEKIQGMSSTEDGETTGKYNIMLLSNYSKRNVELSKYQKYAQTIGNPFCKVYMLLVKFYRQIEEMETGGDVRMGWVLDNFPRNISEIEALHQAGILPDFIFCLADGEENLCSKKLYLSVKIRLQKEQLERNKEAL